MNDQTPEEKRLGKRWHDMLETFRIRFPDPTAHGRLTAEQRADAEVMRRATLARTKIGTLDGAHIALDFLVFLDQIGALDLIEDNLRACEYCGELLPATARSDARFCSSAHRVAAHRRDH